MPDLIFDTTVLSNFAAANRMDILKAEYRSAAFTTIEIQDELRNGSNAGYHYLKHAIRQIETVRIENAAGLAGFQFDLDYNPVVAGISGPNEVAVGDVFQSISTMNVLGPDSNKPRAT